MCRVNKYDIVCEKSASFNAEGIDRRINDSKAIAEMLMQVLKSDSFLEERFMVFMVDVKLRLVGYAEVSRGTIDSSLVHPREVFRAAICTPKASAIIVAHNHPSGDPTPSPQDIEVTERLVKAGEIVGVKVLDHVIVGDGKFTSMKSDGYID